jgi:hypothetical protein
MGAGSENKERGRQGGAEQSVSAIFLRDGDAADAVRRSEKIQKNEPAPGWDGPIMKQVKKVVTAAQVVRAEIEADMIDVSLIRWKTDKEIRAMKEKENGGQNETR